jgi:hypothetical protein
MVLCWYSDQQTQYNPTGIYVNQGFHPQGRILVAITEGDRGLHLELLEITDEILSLLVHDEGEYVLDEFIGDEEYRSDLRKAWERVAERLERAKWLIGGVFGTDALVPPSDDDDGIDYRALDEAGLTGSELKLKHRLIMRFFSRFKGSGTSLRLERVLGGLNSYLGSLAEGIPGAGAIKELKDMLELTLKSRRAKKR